MLQGHDVFFLDSALVIPRCFGHPTYKVVVTGPKTTISWKSTIFYSVGR